MVGKLADGYIRTIYLCCMKYDLKCPEPLRKHYFYSTNWRMIQSYKPKVYPGVFTIIRSPDLYTDPHIGWTDFVEGEIKTIDIPGKHKDRRQILNEPFVELTAKALKKEIENCTG